MSISMVSGGFDPLHVGHLELFRHALRHGQVIVILNSDEWLMKKKGFIFMSWPERASILQALKKELVTWVYPVDDEDGSVCKALKMYKPDVFCNGGDRFKGDVREHEVCVKLGIKEVFECGEKIQSSSNLVKGARF